MGKFSSMFGNDSPFGLIFGKAGDIIITNLLFVLCSIPVVTIGSSLTAMNETYAALANDIGESIPKIFFRSFKAHFKQSAAAWLLMLLLFFVLSVDIHSFSSNGPLPFFGLRLLCMVLLALVLMEALWLFPVIGAYEGTLKQNVLRALYLAARNLPSTLLMLGCAAAAYALTTLNIQTLLAALPVWLFFGFGLLGAICHKLTANGMEKAGADIEKI